MTHQCVVLNLGMPRSGTTLVQKMLEHGVGYFHQKVCEYHPWHPMNSGDLYRLVNTFRRKIVVIVRTTRDVEQVIESMRVGVEMGNPHQWTADEVRRLQEMEAQRWAAFVRNPSCVDRTIDCRHFSFPYEALRNPHGREQVIAAIADMLPAKSTNKVRFRNFLDEHWGKIPVNVGRLMRARGCTV